MCLQVRGYLQSEYGWKIQELWGRDWGGSSVVEHSPNPCITWGGKNHQKLEKNCGVAKDPGHLPKLRCSQQVSDGALTELRWEHQECHLVSPHLLHLKKFVGNKHLQWVTSQAVS